MLKHLGVALGVMAFVAITSTSASAQASKCTSTKVKNAGKLAASLAKCHSKELNKGTADAACEGKATSKFPSGYTKAEAKGGCLAPNGDAGAIQTKTDQFADDVHTQVRGNLSITPANKCDSKKVDAAGKKAAAKTGCHSKAIGKGTPVDTNCLAKAESKFASAIAKLEVPGNTCTNQSGAGLEAIVDAYVQDLLDELTGTGCCAPARIVTTSGSGILQVATLPPFPFPPGVQTTIDAGSADPDCKHNGVVPAGGFTVPVFCIPALGYTSHVEAQGCEAGSGDGTAMVWDAAATCADSDVSRVGDTSDPDGNSCGTLGTGCTTTAGGAGFDSAGNINTTRGDTVCDGPGVHTQLDIPVISTTWNDNDGTPDCPDEDGMFDGGDLLVSQFNFILSPTTGTSNADFTDLNGDSCSFAGNGPDHVKHCAAPELDRPCQTNLHCGHCSVTTAQDCSAPGVLSGCPASETCVAGTCLDGALTGSPAPGPCCTVGQVTTVVASGMAFSGGDPLRDLIFQNAVPASITSCGSPGGDTCGTLTSNVCLD
jgi:hypothetical protein